MFKNKKVILSSIAIIFTLVVSAIFVNFTLATSTTSTDGSEADSGSTSSLVGYSNIDLAIINSNDKSLADSGKDKFNIVQILPAGYTATAKADNDLKDKINNDSLTGDGTIQGQTEYLSTTSLWKYVYDEGYYDDGTLKYSELFRYAVFEQYKTIDKEMASGAVQLTTVTVNEINDMDDDDLEILNNADLIYIFAADYTEYTSTDLSEDLYNFLVNYSTSDNYPLIIDSTTLCVADASSVTGNNDKYRMGALAYKLMTKNLVSRYDNVLVTDVLESGNDYFTVLFTEASGNFNINTVTSAKTIADFIYVAENARNLGGNNYLYGGYSYYKWYVDGDGNGGKSDSLSDFLNQNASYTESSYIKALYNSSDTTGTDSKAAWDFDNAKVLIITDGSDSSSASTSMETTLSGANNSSTSASETSVYTYNSTTGTWTSKTSSKISNSTFTSGAYTSGISQIPSGADIFVIEDTDLKTAFEGVKEEVEKIDPDTGEEVINSETGEVETEVVTTYATLSNMYLSSSYFEDVDTTSVSGTITSTDTELTTNNTALYLLATDADGNTYVVAGGSYGSDFDSTNDGVLTSELTSETAGSGYAYSYEFTQLDTGKYYIDGDTCEICEETGYTYTPVLVVDSDPAGEHSYAYYNATYDDSTGTYAFDIATPVDDVDNDAYASVIQTYVAGDANVELSYKNLLLDSAEDVVAFVSELHNNYENYALKKESSYSISSFSDYDFVFIESGDYETSIGYSIFSALCTAVEEGTYVIVSGDIREVTSVSTGTDDSSSSSTSVTSPSAKAIADIINAGTYRNGSDNKYRVLEIQPDYPIDTELAESQESKSGYSTHSDGTSFTGSYYTVPSDVIEGTAKEELAEDVEYYDFDLTKAKIAYALKDQGISYSDIELTQVSTEALIGMTEDISATYDLVYIGGDISALDKSIEETYKYGSNKDSLNAGGWRYMSSLVPTFIMYYHTGVLWDVYNDDSGKLGVSSAFMVTGVNSGTSHVLVAENGNDLTSTKYNELVAYINSGRPIMVSDELSSVYENMNGVGYDVEELSMAQLLAGYWYEDGQLTCKNYYLDPSSQMYNLVDYIYATYTKQKNKSNNNILWGLDVDNLDKVDNTDKSYGNTLYSYRISTDEIVVASEYNGYSYAYGNAGNVTFRTVTTGYTDYTFVYENGAYYVKDGDSKYVQVDGTNIVANVDTTGNIIYAYVPSSSGKVGGYILDDSGNYVEIDDDTEVDSDTKTYNYVYGVANVTPDYDWYYETNTDGYIEINSSGSFLIGSDAVAEYAVVFGEDSNDDVEALVSRSSSRVRLTLSSSPTTYQEGNSSTYLSTTSLSFTFEIEADSSTYNYTIWVDSNKNSQFDDGDKNDGYYYVSGTVTADTEISKNVQLEDDYFGSAYWRVQITDSKGNVVAERTDIAKIVNNTDSKSEINVLQINTGINSTQGSQSFSDTLYFDIRSQMAHDILYYNPSITNNFSSSAGTTLSENSELGRHEYRFGIVKYDTSATDDDWFSNLADELTDDYDISLDIAVAETKYLSSNFTSNGLLDSIEQWAIEADALEANDGTGTYEGYTMKEYATKAETAYEEYCDLVGKTEVAKADIDAFLNSVITYLNSGTGSTSDIQTFLGNLTNKISTDEIIELCTNAINNNEYYLIFQGCFSNGGTNFSSYGEFGDLFIAYRDAKDKELDKRDEYKKYLRRSYGGDFLSKMYSIIIIGPSQDFGSNKVDLSESACKYLLQYIEDGGDVFFFHDTMTPFYSAGSVNLTTSLLDIVGMNRFHVDMTNQTASYDATVTTTTETYSSSGLTSGTAEAGDYIYYQSYYFPDYESDGWEQLDSSYSIYCIDLGYNISSLYRKKVTETTTTGSGEYIYVNAGDTYELTTVTASDYDPTATGYGGTTTSYSKYVDTVYYLTPYANNLTSAVKETEDVITSAYANASDKSVSGSQIYQAYNVLSSYQISAVAMTPLYFSGEKYGSYFPYIYATTSTANLRGTQNDSSGDPSTYAQTARAVRLNEGLITMYPFSIADTMLTGGTHQQAYALDLENENTTVWYTLAGSNNGWANSSFYAADPYDAMESYFIYTTAYGDAAITYCGAGHTSITGTQAKNNDERMLFINVIVNSADAVTDKPKLKLYEYNDTELTNELETDSELTSDVGKTIYLVEADGKSASVSFDIGITIPDDVTVSSVKIYFDLNWTEDTNRPIYESDRDVLIWNSSTPTATSSMYESIKTLSYEKTKIEYALNGIKLSDSYFKYPGGNYTYIVVEVYYDGSTTPVYAIIKIKVSDTLFELTQGTYSIDLSLADGIGEEKFKLS